MDSRLALSLSLEEKQELCLKIRNLPSKDLIKVVQTLQEIDPEKYTGDEVEVDLDGLTQDEFKKLADRVKSITD